MKNTTLIIIGIAVAALSIAAITIHANVKAPAAPPQPVPSAVSSWPREESNRSPKTSKSVPNCPATSAGRASGLQ